ncbi:MAG: CHAD domain-containing protein, partial [Candidatus Eremiobacteraeota bacterium]|nr:CHAD domain-containing protein [Candidatus Eremiobacteraeota bacterium]
MNGGVERELKLEAPDTFSLARLEPRQRSFVASPVSWKRLHTVYWDTPDLRLTRWGCSLRFRRGEGWTLKLPAPPHAGALYRQEHVFPGDGTSVPREALALATAYLRGDAPRPVAELRTLRTSRQMSAGGGAELAEVVEDDVRVVEGTHVVRRFRQVEIELTEHAPDDALDELAGTLRAAGAGPPDLTPKNVAALGEAARDPELPVPGLHADSPARDLVRAALAASVARFVPCDAVMRLSNDSEGVHQARVAVRRLRSDLRSFLPLLDNAWTCGLRERLRPLGDVLGAARDADVLLERLRRAAESLPDADRRTVDDVIAPFVAERRRAYERVRAMLDGEAYVAILREMVAAAKDPRFSALADRDACDVVDTIVDEAWRTLRKAVRKRGKPASDRDLHRVRIKAKRVRYLAEAIERLAGKPLRRLAGDVESLQTVLGDQHDAALARDRLRHDAASGAHAFVAGELAALEHG